MNLSKITEKDIEFIHNSLSDQDKQKLTGRTILVTGFAGSLGYTLMHYFLIYGSELKIKKIFGMDNFIFGKPKWVERISKNDLFDLREIDVVKDDIDFAESADLIFHMASLASPVFYRKYPIETIDADVTGLRRLLDFFKSKEIKGFLFYSSSEIYGDPHPDQIPTPELYWGNTNTIGPRACYDESKRFGETLCYNFARQYNMPVTVVRPFNNYGPGMRINDQRVVADFAKAIINQEDIVIYSDGKPTRTFDYIADATIGYIKCAIYGEFEVFNIGSDECEISVLDLAKMYQEIGGEHFSYTNQIQFETHNDREYLIDNPNRRCPDITKARRLLGYTPKVEIEEGIFRYLTYLESSDRGEYEW
ncbi:epimerase [Bacillus sp. FJAT-27264]|uniref:NAD-dependent epimerase/dehydratase family protein n=1 Tax=Paenibacillus sp. (strain DSM 101736 / FJAT-27264) TaxID=1850362 RepID=UPI000807D212|nr:NAD-dependent epimerase/dehydratase family protein [Bacillus sp. FJAT-27264]OBZ07887.1 epimerase [Bacillus sp. FJAT-27264]